MTKMKVFGSCMIVLISIHSEAAIISDAHEELFPKYNVIPHCFPPLMSLHRPQPQASTRIHAVKIAFRFRPQR